MRNSGRRLWRRLSFKNFSDLWRHQRFCDARNGFRNSDITLRRLKDLPAIGTLCREAIRGKSTMTYGTDELGAHTSFQEIEAYLRILGKMSSMRRTCYGLMKIFTSPLNNRDLHSWYHVRSIEGIGDPRLDLSLEIFFCINDLPLLLLNLMEY